MANSALIDDLLKQFADNPRRVFARLANEYRKRGELDSAIEICRSHVPLQPGYISGHIVLGQALYDSGSLDEARSAFETALALDPENLIALRHMGDIARTKGDADGARGWYRQLLEIDPQNEEVSAQLEALSTPASAAEPPASEPAAAPANAAANAVAAWGAADTQVADPATNGSAPAGSTPESEPGDAAAATADDSSAAAAEDARAIDESFDESFGSPLLEARMEPVTEPVEEAAEGFAMSDLEAAPFLDEDPVAEAHPRAALDDAPAAGAEYDDGAFARAELDETALSEVSLADSPANDAFDADVPAIGTASFDVSDFAVSSFDAPPAAQSMEPGERDGDAGREMDAHEHASAEDASQAASIGGGTTAPLFAVESYDITLDGGEEEAAPGAFATETMAELYLQQGFPDRALAIYRELAARDPGDASIAERIAQLTEQTGREPAPAVREGRVRSAREFFGVLAYRRPPRSGGRESTAAEPSAELPSMSAPAATPSPVEPHDRKPGREAASALSLDDVFRDAPPADLAASRNGLSFDEFFARQVSGAADPAGGSVAADPDESASATDGSSDDQPRDLELFHAWLDGLKG